MAGELGVRGVGKRGGKELGFLGREPKSLITCRRKATLEISGSAKHYIKI